MPPITLFTPLKPVLNPSSNVLRASKFKPPVPYELKGGSEWFNSGKTMITVHRDDLHNNEVRLIFNKTKPRSVGKIGEIAMRYDESKGRYYTIKPNELNPNEMQYFFAKPKGDETPSGQVEIQTNLNKYAKDDDCPF